MTDVRMRLLEQRESPEYVTSATVTWTPVRAIGVYSGLLLPSPHAIVVSGGPFTMLFIEPTWGGWAWRVVIDVGGVIRDERTVLVPDAAEVDFEDLQVVDPASLTPAANLAEWEYAASTAEAARVAAQASAAAAAADAYTASHAAALVLGDLDERYVTRRTLLALGNSITNYWATGTRFADKLAAFVGALGDSIAVINAGVGGDTTTQMLARLPALLTTNSPTWVTVVPSINDRKIDGSGITPVATMANLRSMIGIIRWAGAEPILMTEPPINPATIGATFNAASEYDRRNVNDWTRTLASELRCVLADVDTAYATNDVSAASGDGLHPIGTLSGGVNGLDAICVTVAQALLTATPTVYGWPHILPTKVGDDPFTRADSTTTLGAPWTARQGTWGISSNRAYAVTNTAWDLATTDTVNANHSVIAAVVGAPGVAYEGGVVARYTSGTGFYFADLAVTAGRAGVAKLYKVTAALSPTLIGSFTSVPGTMADQATIELGVVGTALTVRVNGMNLIQATDSTYASGSKCGIALLAGAKFDDFAWYA